MNTQTESQITDAALVGLTRETADRVLKARAVAASVRRLVKEPVPITRDALVFEQAGEVLGWMSRPPTELTENDECIAEAIQLESVILEHVLAVTLAPDRASALPVFINADVAHRAEQMALQSGYTVSELVETGLRIQLERWDEKPNAATR